MRVGQLSSLTSFALVATACGNIATPPARGVAVGGTVSGLAGTGLVLQNNGSNDLAIDANSSFAFGTALASGDSYSVTIGTQPSDPSQTCTVGGGSGTAGSTDVTSITVNCARNTFMLGGTVSGLDGTVVLETSDGDRATVSANGSFAFPTTLVSGTPYRVTVLSNPDSPAQYCAVTGGTGTVADADVTSVAVTCATNSYPVTGVLVGLPAGLSIAINNNGGDEVTLTEDGGFAFATPLVSGSPYDVAIVTQPVGLTPPCTLNNGSGVMGAGVDTVEVKCCTGLYAFGRCNQALTCADFANHDGADDVQQWCFSLGSTTVCMGAWDNDGACADITGGIEITTDPGASWPLRFNNNEDMCLNYNPNATYVQNLANALGYPSYTIKQTQTGNSCDLSWVDDSGNYATQAGTGNASTAEIYDITFHN